jgi:hypothetical protein
VKEGVEEFLIDPIEGLCRIKLQKVGTVPLPEGVLALLDHNPATAVDDIAIGTSETALVDEFLHGLHAKSNEVYGVGEAEGDSHIEVVQQRLHPAPFNSF